MYVATFNLSLEVIEAVSVESQVSIERTESGR